MGAWRQTGIQSPPEGRGCFLQAPSACAGPLSPPWFRLQLHFQAVTCQSHPCLIAGWTSCCSL